MSQTANLRFVLDTNVLVAALRSKSGASFLLLSALREQRFSPLVSVPLWFEYEAVLKRPVIAAHHGLSEREVDVVLNVIARFAEPVRLNFLWRPQLNDPLDEMVLETALNGRADALVTFNVGDFAIAAPRFSLAVIQPSYALEWIRRRQ